MKKIYSLLAAFVGAAGLTAQADDVTFTLKVDNPGSVSYEVANEKGVLTEEETVLTVDDSYGYMGTIYVSLYPIGDYNLVDITDANDAPVGFVNATYGSFSATNGGVYNITTVNVAASRTASFTLNCDDPSAIVASYNNSMPIEVTSESQVVKFNPETETSIYINSENYNRPLYHVSVDGEEVLGAYGSWEVPITDGCVVDVISKYPDIDYTVTISYGEGTEGFFTSATINDEPFADFDGTGFTAKYGDYIELKAGGDWITDEITVNGEKPRYFYGTCGFLLTEDTEVYVKAHKVGNINFTVNVNNPEYVTVFTRDYNWNDVAFDLQAGDNELQVSETRNEVNYKANPGCYIVSVTDQTGEVYEWGYFTAKEGYTYYIVAEEITLDETAAIYVNKMEEGWYFLANYDLNVTRTELDLTYGGYTVVPFGAGLNPFGFTWYGPEEGLVYVNEEQVEPMYEGAKSYYFSLNDKDVVKIFLDEVPTVCNVTFNAPEGVQANVVRDIITEVADYAAGFTAFNGTQINISGEGVTKVTANGEEVAAEEGTFVVIVNADTEIAIDGVATGVEAIVNAADAPVYNLQGIKVGTRASINSLPAGVYVVEGRKVAVK